MEDVMLGKPSHAPRSGPNGRPKTTRGRRPRADHDSPWKVLLQRYFPDFLEILFPDVHARIDWSRGFVCLDKELQAVVRGARAGRRHVDMLMRVYLQDGSPQGIAVHIEIQGTPDSGFSARMFLYYSRLWDRYQIPILSLAVLTDGNPNFRPGVFEQETLGCGVRFQYLVVKLLDWEVAERWDALWTTCNRIAPAILATVLDRTAKTPEERTQGKIRVLRNLRQRGFERQDIDELYRLIDWILHLPKPQEGEVMRVLEDEKEEGTVSYISFAERHGHEKGLRKGRAEGLKKGLEKGLERGRAEGESRVLRRQLTLRFGELPEAFQQRLDAADAETLLVWSERVLTAPTLDDIFA
jgi:hypothetical protein